MYNLQPTSNYIVQVVAYGHHGNKEYSESIRFETIGIAPEKPQRIAFQILGPSGLQVNWGEPPETNGQILSYEVAYGLDGQPRSEFEIIELPSGHNRSLLIEDLLLEQEYVYEVRAQNEWGWSEVRRARLAIQLDDQTPPSDYVMGKTSSFKGSQILYNEESEDDEAYEPLTHQFTNKQVLDYQMKLNKVGMNAQDINKVPAGIPRGNVAQFHQESAQRQLAGQSMPRAGNFQQGGETSNMSSFTDMHHNIKVSAKEMPSNSHNKVTVQGPMFTSSKRWGLEK